MQEPLNLPVSTALLIPHTPPMRWVKRLVEFDGSEGWVESCRLAENPLFSDSGVLPLYTMAELIAQAYAAVKGYQDLSAGRPIQKGYLVGIRKIEVLEFVPGTRPLLIRIRSAGEFGGFYMADGEVTLDSKCIAQGTVKLWVPGEADEKRRT